MLYNTMKQFDQMLTDVKYNPIPDYYTSIKHSKVPLIQTVPNLQYLTFRHEDRDKAVEIYLTEDELQALYEMPQTSTATSSCHAMNV